MKRATRPKALTPEERKQWRAAMRDVRRIAARPPEDDPEPVPIIAAPQKAPAPAVAPPAKPKIQSSVALPHNLDSETARRLKTKAARPQARLDLHGMTQDAAHTALTAFVGDSVHAGHNLVLIITGKGRLGGGALRRNLPLWLEGPSLRPYIVAIAPALTQDGGDGAFYIQLRRRTR